MLAQAMTRAHLTVHTGINLRDMMSALCFQIQSLRAELPLRPSRLHHQFLWRLVQQNIVDLLGDCATLIMRLQVRQSETPLQVPRRS